MPLIQHVYPWDSQPQEAVEVNRANRLTEGISSLWSGSSGVDVAGPAVFSDTSGVQRAATTQGIARRYTRNGFANAGTAVSNGPGTYILGGISINTFMLLVTRRDSTGAGILRGGSGDGGLQFSGSNVALNMSSGIRLTTSNAVTNGVPFCLFLSTVVDQVIDSNVFTLTLNGVESSLTTASFAGLGRIIDFAFRAGGDTANIDLSLFAAWDRWVPLEEREELRANPWQLFAPRVQYVPTSSGVPMPTLGTPTFVPGSLTSSGFRPRVPSTWA